MHRVKVVSEEFAKNLVYSLKGVDENQVDKVIDKVIKAKKVFILGTGHSGLIGKILAMKLTQLGFFSYVVGEVTTPAMMKGDLLISISQSGETSTILTLTKKAKALGGEVVAVTSSYESSLSKFADIVLVVPAKVEDVNFPILSLLGDEKHKNMSGALFGMNVFALFYGLICELVVRTNQSPERIDSRHANLQ